MLQRYLLNFVLIFLFAFAQIGVAAHEIGHVTAADQHTQQDNKTKNTAAEQCAQCLSYAKVASGLATDSLTLPTISVDVKADTVYASSFISTLVCAYGARAPPQITSI